jgi:hypothetical protein
MTQLPATIACAGTPATGYPPIAYIQAAGALDYWPAGKFGPAEHFVTLTNRANIGAGDFSLIA